MAVTATIKFPEKLRFLFKPMRYKIAYGGRCGSKSWGFARAILLLGASKKLRVLCTREIQRSIKDSVHKLLSDQIELLGLGAHYDVLESSIRGINGTDIIFAGLQTQTVESLKSYEGCDICWVEEAQVVRKRSWDILVPTIRKEGSEIWVSFNPELETDPTYERFIKNPPQNPHIVHLTYRDNPWFSDVSEQERLYTLKYSPKDYPNIWEGICKPAVEGAIYYDEMQACESQGRVCNVPYDPYLKVHVVLDLGWEDSLAAGLVQKNLSEIRVIEYVECHRTKLNIFSAELLTRGYNWGRVWLPHDGYAKTLASNGQSTYHLLKAQGWDVTRREEILEMSVEEGIRTARTMFARCYFDRAKCNAKEAPPAIIPNFYQTEQHNRLIECLKRYRRQINNTTLSAMGPVRDQYTHGADMFRYIACNASKMINETDKMVFDGPTYYVLDPVVGI